jgi:hypothetical protein
MASRRSGGGEREGGGGSRKSPRISSRSIAVDDEETMRWYVADIQHPMFGKEFSDARAIKKGTRVGDRCIIEVYPLPPILALLFIFFLNTLAKCLSLTARKAWSRTHKVFSHEVRGGG